MLKTFLTKLIEFLQNFLNSLDEVLVPVLDVEKVKPGGVLVIVVGHNMNAKGARGIQPINMQEYDFNKNYIAPEMLEHARNRGLETHVLYKDGKTTAAVGIDADRLCINKKGAIIELHFNATAGATGTETLYSTHRLGNRALSLAVQAAMVRTLQLRDRGVKVRDSGRGAANLNSYKTTDACLVEPAFGDTPLDAQRLWSRKREYARALVDAAIDHLEV